MAKNIRPGSPIDHAIKGGKAIAMGALTGAAVANNTWLADTHPNGAPIAGAIAGGLAGLAGHVGYTMGRKSHLEDAANNARR
jgi:outer membrane lipoprotein SlyB